ncbi:MAG: DEAD/DEAH box helicase family protein [Desulfobacterales bacterium]|uniref:DEAD/DEAH box helicase family protein n=1 Tax=Candidatus Desulfatibia profunda TaxID=2841695 RepID=A0A8J6NPX5_9BACT|nr:DEAD/DEAH box helicase family protein [Candidatus Desulfatibia profunda]MBL7178848.1 DEAD/DEAH box helicase family protein [Desulfobacterales bacterium]MBL7207772.1 DEAD/DEAH box helicase family protein [Desulfobacterales bacterium]
MIKIAQEELAELDAKRERLLKQIETLTSLRREEARIDKTESSFIPSIYKPAIANSSSEEDKIALFRSLFRGREDIFPKRFESLRSAKSGYQPACRNEWIRGICKKPKVKCNECENRDFLPVTDEVIKSHLLGVDLQNKSKRNFTIGIYPLLLDETCWFLAIDFDKESWIKDVSAFLDTCEYYKVPASLERSRSGNGGHIWIFFSEPIQAQLARKLGSFLITETMEHRPEIGFESYDRFFPSQDTMPQGGFGSLIALPLQKAPKEKGNSLFVNKKFVPYPDQWAYLSSIKRMSCAEVEKIVEKATEQGRILGVKMVASVEENILPWLEPPSRLQKETPIKGPLPEKIKLVWGNQIYIEKESLTPSLKNRLIRLAAFQNPEFYKAQAMRFPTFNKPRIIHCCEDFKNHIGLPRGCLDDIKFLLESYEIKVELVDERCIGKPINVEFHGTLRPEQEKAFECLLKHDIGVLSASTAFGKTIVAINLLAQRAVNTLILVHRKILLDQWVARLRTFLEIDPKEIGQIGGGKRKPKGKVDVALIQSLSKRGVVDDIVGEYGHLIVDECHHISARSFEIVARQCKAKYITGLSATVVRKDGHHPIIFMNCGPIRYKVDDKKQAELRPFKHKVIIRDTNFRLPDSLYFKENLTINDYYAALIVDEQRNNMIIEDVIRTIYEKRSPVLLTERRDHIDILVKMLTPLVKNIFVLKGGMGKKQRQSLLDKMRNLPYDEERIIIATGRYLGEGFDDARLDTLFLTLPISWRGTIAQYAGRLHRVHDMKKEVIVYDYADLNVSILTTMHLRRLNGYKTIGYEIDETLL